VAQSGKELNAILLRGTLAMFLGLGSAALVVSLREALKRKAAIGSLEFWLLLSHAALIGVMLLCAMAVWRRKKWGLATLVGASLVLFNVNVYAQIVTPGMASLLLLLPPALVALAAWPSWGEFT
jgi:hypothetical protein